MKDNEIIKALECCAKADCDNCPNTFGNCEQNLLNDTIDLINRQKAEIQALREDVHNRKTRENKLRSKIKSFRAEIDRLNSELKATSGAALSYKAEIERLEKDSKRLKKIQMQLDDAMKMYSIIKAEAVKEVIETMKPWYRFLCVDKGDWYEQLDAHAYNFVKEMVGEEK